MLYTNTLVADPSDKAITIRFNPNLQCFQVLFHVSKTEPKPFASFQEAKDWVDLYGPLYTEGLYSSTTPTL
jgi:hypothetical protein